MANTFITPSLVSREFVLNLKNECIAFPLMFNPVHQAEFSDGVKKGDTIKIRVPGDGDVREMTGTASARDMSTGSEDLVLEKWFYDQVSVNSKELTLELDMFNELHIRPIAIKFAEKINGYVCTKAKEIPYFVGTAADPPDTIAEIIAVNSAMNANKASRPRVGICSVSTTEDMLNIESVRDADKRGDGGLALQEAEIGRVAKINWYEDQSVYSHTAGTMQAETPLVDGVVAAGATSMDIDDVGAGTQTILTGDLFTVAGATGQYVFTNDTTAVAGQITGATFYPAAPTGGFADDAAITIVASHEKNLVFGPQAFTAVAIPTARSMSAPSDSFFAEELGVGITVTFDRNASGLADVISFEMLVGAKALKKESAMILLG